MEQHHDEHGGLEGQEASQGRGADAREIPLRDPCGTRAGVWRAVLDEPLDPLLDPQLRLRKSCAILSGDPAIDCCQTFARALASARGCSVTLTARSSQANSLSACSCRYAVQLAGR